MSDAPERITAWGDQATLGVVYKAGPRPMQNMVPFRATEYTRADLSDALLREAAEALISVTASLVASVSLLGRGGKKAAASDRMFIQMLEDYEGSIAVGRATLAKLRSHMGGNHE